MKKSLLLCLCQIFICSFSYSAEIPEPYRSAVDLPFDPQGWFVNERQLTSIFANKKPKVIIEVGSWLGCSTRCLASNLPEDGIVYAVDTWKGSQNEALHLQDPRLPQLYAIFLSNIKHAGLTHKIVPVRMESTEAAKTINVMADLIYLDGAHDTPSVINDITSWYPHLKAGGVMCGDDWLWESVRAAVIHCGSLLNKDVYSDENFWWFAPDQ